MSHELKITRQLNLVICRVSTIEIVLIKSNAEKKAGRRVPDLFLLFEKALR